LSYFRKWWGFTQPQSFLFTGTEPHALHFTRTNKL